MMRRFYLCLLVSIMLTAIPLACLAAEPEGEQIVPGAPVRVPAPPLSVAVLYDQAKAFVDRGVYASAEPLIDEGLRVDPAYFPLWKLRAITAMHMGKFSMAEEAVGVCIGKDPLDMESRSIAIDIALRKPGQSAADRGREISEVLRGLSEKSLSELLFAFVQKDDLRQQLPLLLGSWREAGLGLPAVWTALDLYRLGEIDRAISTIDSAYGSDMPPTPLRGALYYIFAKYVMDRGGDERAIKLLDSAQKGGFPAMACAELVGEIHLSQRRFREAAEVWEKYWREAEHPHLWVVRIANAWLETGDYEKAAAILQQGMSAFPKNAAIQGKYLFALHKQGLIDEENRLTQRLDGLNARVGLSYGRALIFADEGRTAEAKTEMKRANEFAAASSGSSYSGDNLEYWFARMDRSGGAVVIDPGEAIRLRDRGWNYWQEKEYRKAYDVWLEAIDLGFPQVRVFIVNISTRLLEVGMAREAAGLLHQHLPDVPPIFFAHRLASENRWDIVEQLLRLDSSGKYSPWDVLYSAYATLRMGKRAQFDAYMIKLAGMPAPRSALVVTGIDDQGRIMEYSLAPEYYTKMVTNIAREAMRQRTPQIVLRMIDSNLWKMIPESDRIYLFGAAAGEIVRQGDAPSFLGLIASPEWRRTPEKVRLDFVASASRVLVVQRNIDLFMDFIELPEWKQLPSSARNEVLVAASEEMIAMQMTELFPLFLENPNWLELPSAERSTLLVNAGRLLYKYGYDEQALPYFEESAAADPGNGSPYAYLALIQKQRGNDAEAKSYFERALQGRITEVDRVYMQAMFAFLDEDGPEAAKHFLAYLKLVPDDHLARYQVINLLVAMYRFAEARELKEEFETMYRQRVAGIDSYVALTHQAFDEAAEAEAIWANLVEQNPGQIRYLRNWGSSLNAQGKFERTLELLAEPCRTTGDRQLAVVLTEAAFALQLYEETLEWVDQGLDSDPENVLLLRFGGEAAESLGRYDLAEQYASRSILLQPDSIAQQRLYNRSLIGQQKWEELHSRDIELLRDNPLNEFALNDESEYAKAMNGRYRGTRKVHRYLLMDRKINRQILNNYRQDPTNWLDYAIAAAGDSYFHGAIPAIRHLYDMGPNQALAILRYPQVSVGLSEVGIPILRVREQIEALLNVGHTFVSPTDIPVISERGRTRESSRPIPILLTFDRADARALKQLDALLREKGITACLVVGEESFYEGTPIWPDRQTLRSLADSGRWTILLTDYTGRRIVQNEAGDTASFWGTPIWLGDRLENEEEMYMRWRIEMSRLKNLAAGSGVPVAGWVYPQGTYGQLTIETATPSNRAYKRAVEEVFALGFASGPAGFWAPHQDLWRLPARSVYLGTDTVSLVRSLTRNQPTRQAILEFAKILSWHGQLPRADELFRRAEAEGLELKDVYYFHGRNALYQGDVPVAMDLARKAAEVDPVNPRVDKLFYDIDRAMRPRVDVTPVHSWDSDGRDYYGLDARYFRYINEKTAVYGGLTFSKWERDGLNSITGYTPSIGFRRHVRPGHWFDAGVGLTVFGSGGHDPIPRVDLGWHGQINRGDKRNFNGTYDLTYHHGGVETVEAIEENIRNHTLALATSLRVLDFWDVDARLFGTHFTDDNHSYGGSLRVLYRFREKPLIRGGYLFEAADSRRNPPEYYAPVDYMHHAAVLDYRHYITPKLYISFLGTYGMARSQGNDWDRVWRANGNINWRINDDWGVSLGHSHLELPSYTLDETRGTLFRIF